MNIKTTFETTDLALATAISLWLPITALDRNDPNKIVFHFNRESDLDSLIETFWRRELKVDALTYFNQIKLIKSRIYEK